MEKMVFHAIIPEGKNKLLMLSQTHHSSIYKDICAQVLIMYKFIIKDAEIIYLANWASKEEEEEILKGMSYE